MRTKITELLQIEYPIFQGGMAWVAEHKLAAAVSNAGGLGIIGAASAPPEVVREEIRKCKELTDKQLAELLTKGKTGTIRGFVKNGGGTFDAALTLDDQFKTSFVFEPRDTPRQGKRNKRK